MVIFYKVKVFIPAEKWKKRTSVTGYESRQAVYRCQDCTGCQYFEGKCTRSKKYKQLYASKVFVKKRETSLKNILSLKTKFLLLCMGYNINKLHAKIQNDRLKSHLFKLKTT